MLWEKFWVRRPRISTHFKTRIIPQPFEDVEKRFDLLMTSNTMPQAVPDQLGMEKERAEGKDGPWKASSPFQFSSTFPKGAGTFCSSFQLASGA